MKKKYLLRQIFLIGSLFLLFSCENEELVTYESQKRGVEPVLADDVTQEATDFYYGPKIDLGNGYVNSWISVDKFKVPIEIGIEISPAAFEGLPLEIDLEKPIIVPLPEIAQKVTPFDHIGLQWNPDEFSSIEGFKKAHFGIYFYMITVSQRSEIPIFSPSSEQMFDHYPPRDYMPFDYSPVPKGNGAVVFVGQHWLSSNPETYLPFSHTVALGTYDGRNIFVNPIATIEFLQSGMEVNGSFSQPLNNNNQTLTPKGYNIYVNENRNHVISLDNFLTR
jgi:hypothetical protein